MATLKLGIGARVWDLEHMHFRFPQTSGLST